MNTTQLPSISNTNQLERLQILETRFLQFLENFVLSTPVQSLPKPYLQAIQAIELFHSQCLSRLLDIQARLLKEQGDGFYTIASSGHEGNVVLGDLLRLSDFCLLHYRSGAMFIQRSRKAPEIDVEKDLLLSLLASQQDPTCTGRHKVFGSKRLNVIPQTSTISSHIPKAMGMAYGLEVKKRKWAIEDPNAIVCCSFGDGSVNHSTLLGGLNAAQWIDYLHLPIPLLLVCEDNGISISVKTPKEWIYHLFGQKPGLTYFRANGLHLDESYRVTQEAIEWCRTHRRPVFLHLQTIRLGGHAGSDPELSYRPLEDVEATESLDPIKQSAQFLLEQRWITAGEIIEWYKTAKARIASKAEMARKTPKLTSIQEITHPIRFPANDRIHQEITQSVNWLKKERESFYDVLPEQRPPDTLCRQINSVLLDTLIQYPQSFIFGEDVARKGGVYTVTKDLMKKMGSYRVFNTLLDEQAILGVAQGFGALDLLPIPEIQYLAYIHNAIDQLRGEACSLAFFSNNQFFNPMVVRIASMAYQKGFGGHFHNDNSVAALRDIPGLLLALPSRGDDAVKVFRTLMAAALVEKRVSCFLEPIALYFTRDLYKKNDKLWLSTYPKPGEYLPIGEGRCYSSEKKPQLTFITYGNGTLLSLQAAKILEEKQGIPSQVVDLIWLNPLNESWIREKALETGKVVVVDECRRTGGLSEAIITALYETHVALQRITAEDTYIPLGVAANLVLPSVDSIYQAACRLLK